MTEEKKKSKERPAEKTAAKKQPAAAAENKHAQESKPATAAAEKERPGGPESRGDVPAIKPGDELKVFYRVIEAGKERTQIYEGTVIAIKNSASPRPSPCARIRSASPWKGFSRSIRNWSRRSRSRNIPRSEGPSCST